MNLWVGLLWIFIYILFFLNEYNITMDLPHLNQRKKSLAAAFIKTGIFALGWFLNLPLFCIYIFMILGYGMTFSHLFGKQRMKFLFWVNFSGICFLSVHLICLSAVSLFTSRMLRDVYQRSEAYLLVLFVTLLLLLSIGNLLRKNGGITRRAKLLTSDEKRFGQLILFEWYALAYLLFDSIPFMLELPYILLSLFLIGSCFLLLLQLMLVLAHTYRIIKKACYEAEYYRLEEERASHVKRQMTLHKLAYMDGLTGVFTRRYAIEMLESMHRDQMDVTIAYIDVNGLKKVNDTLGHPEGDNYLKTIANSLNASLSKSDILSRIGGDEFLIVSNSLDMADMEATLEQINRRLLEQEQAGYRPSFSYGVVSALHSKVFDLDELLMESDRKMYNYKTKFKREGFQ